METLLNQSRHPKSLHDLAAPEVLERALSAPFVCNGAINIRNDAPVRICLGNEQNPNPSQLIFPPPAISLEATDLPKDWLDSSQFFTNFNPEKCGILDLVKCVLFPSGSSDEKVTADIVRLTV